ncbi:MAG: TIGR04063 family PEP-CTERM/XrtA system glycosyltransferase [Gammaproteobacteria bacterium]
MTAPDSSEGSLRILHVLDESLPLHSGYVFRTVAILREQRSLGWQTFQLTGPKQGPAIALQEQVGEWVFERTPSARGWWKSAPVVKHWRLIQALKARLRNVARVVQPHIIHVHSPVLNALPALAVGREMGVPVVYEIRAFWEDAAVNRGTAREGGIRYLLTRALETHAARRADAVATICEGLRGDLIRRGIPAEKITVIPNAVDIERFQANIQPDQGLQKKYGLQEGATVGFAGSFYGYEGLELLLRAMAQVMGVMPQARLLLLGGERQDSNLRKLSQNLGLDGVVHFIGRVPHEEMERYYSVMDAMVYPRISCRLTELVTPLKPLEAMALGKPVIASDVGGHRELIRDLENGYLFQAGSVAALTSCLLKVLHHGSARASIASTARRYVETERNWKGSVARYKALYAEILGFHGQLPGQALLGESE